LTLLPAPLPPQDDSPLVATNAIAALRDLQARSGMELALTAGVVHRLLLAAAESSEWATVPVLEAVAEYSAGSSSEARSIVERAVPLLNHANSAVVLTAARCAAPQVCSKALLCSKLYAPAPGGGA
jgi:AP-1 complex subunit beta-1